MVWSSGRYGLWLSRRCLPSQELVFCHAWPMTRHGVFAGVVGLEHINDVRKVDHGGHELWEPQWYSQEERRLQLMFCCSTKGNPENGV